MLFFFRNFVCCVFGRFSAWGVQKHPKEIVEKISKNHQNKAPLDEQLSCCCSAIFSASRHAAWRVRKLADCGGAGPCGIFKGHVRKNKLKIENDVHLGDSH
jgi:hypothetical protein